MKTKWMNGKCAMVAISILLSVLLVSIFCGCGNNNKLAGEYYGTFGSYLKLNKDGSCVYAEDNDSTGTGTGVWYVKDNVIYVETDNLRYTIFAEIRSVDDGLLFKANSDSWRDEYFSKR